MNIIQFNIMLPKGISLVIIGIAIAAGTEIISPYATAPFQTSLFDYEDIWSTPLFQNDSVSKPLIFEEDVNEILFFVDYDPLSAHMRLEVVGKDSKVVYEEEIFQSAFVQTPFLPEQNSSYDLRITNLDRIFVDIYDLGYVNYQPEKSEYIVPLDEWYTNLALAVFIFGIALAIVGGILFFKKRQKNKISQMSSSEIKIREARVNIVVQVLLCIIVPILALAAFYRIHKLGKGIFIVLGSFAFSITLQMFLPFPFGLVSGMSFLYFVPLFFVMIWSFEWNNSISKK